MTRRNRMGETPYTEFRILPATLDGWRDESWIYIDSECWHVIHKDEDAIDMARLHQAAGLLRTQKGKSLQFRMGREVTDRPRVYAVRASALIIASNDRQVAET